MDKIGREAESHVSVPGFCRTLMERLEVTLFALQNVNKDITLKLCNNVLSHPS